MSLFTPENIANGRSAIRFERVRLPGRMARTERALRNLRRFNEGRILRPHRRRIYVHVNGKQLNELEGGGWKFRQPAEW